jgi:hypothetical protein
VTRWPLILMTLGLVGAATAVIGRRAVEPEQPQLSPNEFDKFVAEPVAEETTLRIIAKRHIAREAADGTRPLLQAAALFRVLNRYPPALPAAHPSSDGRSEEERLCRQVIMYVTSREDGGAEADAAAVRLEAELQEVLRREGTVQFPDPVCLPSAEELLEEARAMMTEAERRACFPNRCGHPPGQ